MTPLLTAYPAVAAVDREGRGAASESESALSGNGGERDRQQGQEPRSQTAITFFSDTGLDELESYWLRAATTILQMRLRDVLREELGGTYSVSVGYSDTAPQPGYGTTSVQFGSSPENAERLRNVVLTELDKLRRDGPTESEVGIVKETERRELETALRAERLLAQFSAGQHLLRAADAPHPAEDRENGIARDRQYPRSLGDFLRIATRSSR